MAGGSEGVRRGSPGAFWNNALVKAPTDPTSISNHMQIGRGTNMFCFFISSTVTAAFKLQVAHVGSFTSSGVDPFQFEGDPTSDVMPDPDAAPFIWHDLWYLGTSGVGNSTPVTVNGTGAWAIASIVPDFEPDWIRLVRTDAGSDATVTAGFEAWGD